MRNVDRTVKDLQAQIDRREKSVTILSEDLSKSRDKVERLLQTIDELQASDSSSQLTAKRAERELREVRAVPERVGDVVLGATALGRVVDPHLAEARRLQEHRLERV